MRPNVGRKGRLLGAWMRPSFNITFMKQGDGARRSQLKMSKIASYLFVFNVLLAYCLEWFA